MLSHRSDGSGQWTSSKKAPEETAIRIATAIRMRSGYWIRIARSPHIVITNSPTQRSNSISASVVACSLSSLAWLSHPTPLPHNLRPPTTASHSNNCTHLIFVLLAAATAIRPACIASPFSFIIHSQQMFTSLSRASVAPTQALTRSMSSTAKVFVDKNTK